MQYFDNKYNDNLSIDLNGCSPFSEGGNRWCYVHPNNPSRCLKVLKTGRVEQLRARASWYKRLRSARYFDDNLREADAHNQPAITSGRETVWQHLSRWYGLVDTSLGVAAETELILSRGSVAPTLEHYLIEQGMTEAMQIAIDQFETWLRKTLLLTKNILPHNLVVQETPSGLRLVIIDGIGSSSFFKLPELSNYFARLYIERRIQRMHTRINWEVGGRQGAWKEVEKQSKKLKQQ